jgi:hypothetical protein
MVLPDGATPFKQGNVVRDSADAERLALTRAGS